MRRDSLLLLGLLTTICLIAGLVVGIQWGNFAGRPLEASPTAPRPTPAVPSPQTMAATPAPILQPTLPTQQMALLIIGVDDKTAAQPKLEGSWIVAFSPGTNQYYVLGFPAEARLRASSTSDDNTLTGIYAQGLQQQLGSLFVRNAIQAAYTPFAVQAVVTIDRNDVADLAGRLGGLSVGGQVYSGDDLIAAYDTQSFAGTAAQMEFQHATFAAVLQALSSQQWSPSSLSAYIQIFPARLSQTTWPASSRWWPARRPCRIRSSHGQ